MTDVSTSRAAIARPTQSLFARLKLRELVLVPVIAVVMVIGSFVSSSFLMPENLLNILQQSSELSILVIAQSLILICGKFDLSLESTVGIAPMFAAWLMIADVSLGGSGIGISGYAGIAVVLATGLLIGLINGLLVVKLRLNAFITTLAMLILLRGVTLGITNGQTLFDLPEPFLYLGNAKWAGIPASIWIAGLLFLFFGLMMRYHRIGRAIYAIGGNPEAARVAGIPVERITLGVFVVGSLLAALAGLLLTGRIASVVSSQGQNMIFYVFAASVIGGISLNGGQGRLIGALTGVLLLGLLQNVLTLSQVAAFWIDACYGAIILLALIITRLSGETPRA
ncbi:MULTISPECIES: ABC transporter permease [unclassified Mesorhizobium]|uniref:ABC transporter permease n=1 Tax=unclassified Mesorhizobium TaxID=325217 RepID=UPI00086A8C31|nr:MULTISPECIES: ABC transporter permease [unclassified Mesorhizobium]MBN9253561.1 ABC transporter permease [Mesorhizobium sp.]MBN9271331.1 ABC transporter permease [Mesorhizobium sp.]ODT12879.1 MAG: ATPase [Mesorhizobium sp. SCN 65-12]OJX82020.1 MAG: ATPase [Mesorhizobium sp. 65-26]